MSTLLEMRIEELEEQNAALAAQVEALRNIGRRLWGSPESTDRQDVEAEADLWLELNAALLATPQHHMRQVRAEAVLDAVNEHEKKYGNSHFGRHLREYADSILAGKE